MDEDIQEIQETVNTAEQIEAIQNALEKREEEGVLEPEADISSPTCFVCKHPGCRQATDIYFENNKSIESVKQWFSMKFKKNFADGTIEKHFRDHIEPFVTQLMMIKEKRMNELEKKVAKTGQNTNRIAIVKEIIFDILTDIYASKPREIKTKEDRVNYQSTVKMITDLSKSFREYYQMEFEILGFGKTEEEQKEIMKNYLKTMIGKVAQSLDDIPEAKERLYAILGTPSKPNPVAPENIENKESDES